MPEQLYYHDPYCHRFTASVVDRRTRKDGYIEMALDQTAFYPEGGGQPADRGRIGEAVVTHVYKEHGEIWHVVDRDPLAGGAEAGPDHEAGGSGAASSSDHKQESEPVAHEAHGYSARAGGLHAELDWNHRFDYMQQHTGQHILSATFLHVAGLETVSVHQGEEYTTIEFDAGDLAREVETEIEDRANTVITEARRVHAFWCDEGEVPNLGLRRPPKVSGSIRIVEIDDYDRVACGGVHTTSTAEVSLIRILGRERIRGRLRYAFLIGRRAHEHHRAARDTLARIGEMLSVPPLEAPARVEALDTRVRDLEYERNGLKQKLAAMRAGELAERAEPIAEGASTRSNETGANPVSAGSGPAADGASASEIGLSAHEVPRFVSDLTGGEDPGDLRTTAESLVEYDRLAFVLGTWSDKGLIWIIGFGPGITIDLKELKKKAFPAIGAKGGGKPPLFQGKAELDGDQKAFGDNWEAFVAAVRDAVKPAGS